jgi:hypothetical protein
MIKYKQGISTLILGVISLIGGLGFIILGYYYKGLLSMYFLYAALFYPINFAILLRSKRTKFWWLMLVLNLILTIWPIVYCVIYFRLKNLGH